MTRAAPAAAAPRRRVCVAILRRSPDGEDGEDGEGKDPLMPPACLHTRDPG